MRIRCGIFFAGEKRSLFHPRQYRQLAKRDVFFVVRKKTNTLFKVIESLKPSCAPDIKKHSTQILADEKVQPTGSKTSAIYTASGGMLRLVKAFVEVSGQQSKRAHMRFEHL